jgi:hypothetical protein
MLCSSSLYDFLVDQMDKNNAVSSSSRDKCRFLDKLTNLGFLNHRSSSLEEFKDMVLSKDPFYEV